MGVYLYIFSAVGVPCTAGLMAYNECFQMNCCIACGGPFATEKNVLRDDGVAARSLLYVEGKVCKDSRAWGVSKGVDVNLVGKKEALHMVHKTNFIPVLKALIGGKLRNLWVNTPTPGYTEAHNDTVAPRQVIDESWYCISNPPTTPGGRY